MSNSVTASDGSLVLQVGRLRTTGRGGQRLVGGQDWNPILLQCGRHLQARHNPRSRVPRDRGMHPRDLPAAEGALVVSLCVALDPATGQAPMARKRPVSVVTSCPEPDPSVQAPQGSLSQGQLTVTPQSSMGDPAWGETQQPTLRPAAPTLLGASSCQHRTNCSSQRQSSSARGPRASTVGDKYTKQARNPPGRNPHPQDHPHPIPCMHLLGAHTCCPPFFRRTPHRAPAVLGTGKVVTSKGKEKFRNASSRGLLEISSKAPHTSV